MSSSRFRRLVEDAYRNNDSASALNAYLEYQDTQCLHPIRRKIVDSHTQQVRTIDVACGRCFHCMQTKINEWCTRMYAHAEDFKNVYFITLTYRSFHDMSHQSTKLLVDKLAQAVWNRDSFNSTKHLSYNPCLLCKDHYQKFLKRLRKNTGLNDLTYVMSGEYGHDYGRPHYHMILFTNGTISRADVVRAWSVCLWRKNDGTFVYRNSQRKDGFAVDMPIGRVDFHDLVTNGTFNTTAKIKVDGNYMNAANCFAYVCKYVVKRDNVNYNRVNLAYRNMFQKVRYTKVYNKDVPFNIAFDYLTSLGYTPEYSKDILNKQLKYLSYDKFIYQPQSSVYADSLCIKKHFEKPFEYDVELFPALYQDFKHQFCPFCEFSRGCPIGSVYAKRHIQEFTDGVFKRPILQTAGYVVPSYFRLKASHKLYGLRKIHKTLKSASHVLSGLVDLQGRFEDAYKNSRPLVESLGDGVSYSHINEYLRDVRKVFVDEYTGERIILYNGYAQHYKFSRSSRSYKFTRAVKIPEWLSYWLSSLESEQSRYKVSYDRSRERMKQEDASMCILSGFGYSPTVLRDNYESRQKWLLEHHQQLYHDSHMSVE